MSLPSRYLPPKPNSLNLDRDFFQKKLELIGVSFSNPKFIQPFIKKFKNELLNLRNTSNIVKDDDSKLVLLNDKVTKTNLESENLQENLSKDCINYLVENKATLKNHSIILTYKFWNQEEILNSILPKNDELPTSFTIVGHIAHFNLRDEYLPFKNLIGQVVIDKNPNITTVVNKTTTIATKFRTFPMEVIAGEEDFNVTQLESKCLFKFNFKDVYWNTRLQGEHQRLVDKYFKKGELICDVMAGVGPFSIPAAKNNKSLVLANDLNPESYKYLNINIKENKVENFVKSFNVDGKEMIKKSVFELMKFYSENNGLIDYKVRIKVNDAKKSKLQSFQMSIPKHISHYVMNLPDSALTFLPFFINCLNHSKYLEFIESYKDFKLPWIHVYCFEKYSIEENPSFEELESRLLKKVNDLLEYNFQKSDLNFHLVRKVAPTKYMYCISFELPTDLAFKN